MSELYTFWDTMTPYRTESVHLLVLMNSATIYAFSGSRVQGYRVLGRRVQGLRVEVQGYGIPKVLLKVSLHVMLLCPHPLP